MASQDNTKKHHFPNVALLVTHYNRSHSLERLLEAFGGQGWVFDEIVVSDDGSTGEHQQQLQRLKEIYGFKLVTSQVNKGLGNNLNKGQDAVTATYTFYVQEDFAPSPGLPSHFANALAIMKEQSGFDITRFYAFFKYPYLQPYKYGFSEMKFGFWKAGYRKFFCYSDHPHLRRSDFLKKFGRYMEGVNGRHSEYKMMMAFLKHKGRALYYDNNKELFSHINSLNEPTTMPVEPSWKQSRKPVVKRLRDFYRYLRYYKDYLFQ